MSGAPYSCWPVILTVYNLPPGMCMQRQYMYLSMVIPGPKSPGKNLDVFLRPLIDELKMLWEAGIQTYDVCKKENFQMRAALLWTISDFLANAMVSGWSTHGLMACPYCMELTKSFSLRNGRKPSWKFDAAMMKDNPSINHIELGSLRDTNFVGWFNKYVEDPSNAVDDRIVRLSYLPCRVAKRYKGYFVNGFKFHTKEYGNSKSTMNSGVWVWGTSNENDMTDYYGMLEEIIELEYFGNENKVVLFKCHWYDTTSNNGIRVHPRLKLVEVNQKSKLNTSDKFILAQQAQQVYYTDFPKHPIRHSRSRVRGEWRAVCKIKARSRIDVPHLEEHDDNDQLIHEGPFQEMEGSISEPRTNMNFVEEDHDPLNPDFDLQEVDPKDLARPQAHLFDIAEEEEGEEEEDDEEGAFENLFSNDEENLHENEDNEISDCDDEIDYDD
ncbi:hypothetical protein BUALT_Bualt02G0119500 [Buddleja alternifolia]|uniref:DUF4216 domain-containing protein n=1 Tax=Buddleja alternifolia TaxID=168488 RepID=A0AAV6XZK9_9LAMI|nr:hypothetical protein BUALT_Bualt02G0119500 [Buddleja alternifolia]